MARRGSSPCPHCGADVPARSLACPECGSDGSTGWSDEAEDWAGDLSGGYDEEQDDEAYQAFLRAEGLAEAAPWTPRRRRTVAIAVVLLACILLWILRR